MANTKVRGIRIDNETWVKVQKIAAANNEPAANYVRRIITEATKDAS